MLNLFLEIFVPLLIILNPSSTLALFSALTSNYSAKERKLTARRTVRYAALLLIIFAITGSTILSFLGIKIYSLRIAGGILLAFIGLDMVRRGRQFGESTSDKRQKADFALVPLAMPSLSGPGAITFTIVSMTTLIDDAKAVGISFLPPQIILLILTTIAIVVSMIITYVVLLGSEVIIKVLGGKGMDAFTRIMGLLTVAIAVQFVLNGIQAWVSELI